MWLLGTEGTWRDPCSQLPKKRLNNYGTAIQKRADQQRIPGHFNREVFRVTFPKVLR